MKIFSKPLCLSFAPLGLPHRSVENVGLLSRENGVKGLVYSNQPCPLFMAFDMQISNQARWAVLQSFKLLREHQRALDTVVKALNEGETLGNVVRDLEINLSSGNPHVT